MFGNVIFRPFCVRVLPLAVSGLVLKFSGKVILYVMSGSRARSFMFVFKVGAFAWNAKSRVFEFGVVYCRAMTEQGFS